MRGLSYTTPGLLPHTASVIWNDVRVISVDSSGWSNVSLEWRHLPDEIDVSDSWDTQCKVEHQSRIGAHIHHESFEGCGSIVNFDFEA